MVNMMGNSQKLVKIANKARGRTPLKYEFEVIPFFAGELPSGFDKLAFVWERGTKVFATEAEPVNPHTRAVFWKQYLKQSATVYSDANGVQPKEYTFKVQHVRDKHGHEERKTVGKVKVDLSTFCTEEPSPVPQEVFLQLKPVGKLKVSIKAAWLKDAKVDMDGLTEASFTTHRSAEREQAGDEEQDLSGFDESTQHSTAGDLDRASVGPGSPASMKARQQQQQQQQQQQGGSPRIPAAGTRAIPGAVPVGHSTAAFSVGPSPHIEEERARLQEEVKRTLAEQMNQMDRMRRTAEEALRDEFNAILEAQRNGGWRAIFCCCLPQTQPRVRTTTMELSAAAAEAEQSNLLTPRPAGGAAEL